MSLNGLINAKKILVTGSAGRIGKVLVAGLTSEYTVYRTDLNEESGNCSLVCDISDNESVTEMFAKLPQIDAIIHLAATVSLTAGWESILPNNIVGTQNIYAAALQHSVPRIVFASSNHVTGGHEGIPPTLHTREDVIPITWEASIRPDSFYGTSKAFGEALARQYYELHGIQSICLRIGSLIADDDPRGKPRLLKTWLSHRDGIQLIKRSIEADVPFGIYYGISNNKGRFWDIENAKEELGYRPQDDASQL